MNYSAKLNIFTLTILFITSINALLNTVSAQTDEYILKAGFIEKFARFSSWPDKTLDNTFKISIIGESPISEVIEDIYRENKIKNMSVEIKYIKSVFEINDCNILFIASSEKKRLSQILEQTENKPILTISESKGFAKNGVIINFYRTSYGTIHFEINQKSLKKCGVKMDIMLLDFAKNIK